MDQKGGDGEGMYKEGGGGEGMDQKCGDRVE